MEVIEQGKEMMGVDANTSTGSVMCQLTDPEGEPLGAPLHLPQTAGRFSSSSIDFSIIPGACCSAWCLLGEKQSVGREGTTNCIPTLSIFRIRPVSRCSATIAGHTESVLSVAFSPDSRHLASGSGDTTVRLWDLNTQTPLFTCTEHKNWVLYIAWSPDGKHLASGSKSGELLTWDPQTGKLSGKPLNGHKKWITGISWEPVHLAAPCRRFVSSSKDGDARIWDVTLRRCLRSLSGHIMAVTCVKWGGDGWIYTGSQDCTIKIWRPSDGTLLRDLKVWDIRTNKLKQDLPSHAYEVFAVDWSPDGEKVASGGRDRVLKLWMN